MYSIWRSSEEQPLYQNREGVGTAAFEAHKYWLRGLRDDYKRRMEQGVPAAVAARENAQDDGTEAGPQSSVLREREQPTATGGGTGGPNHGVGSSDVVTVGGAFVDDEQDDRNELSSPGVPGAVPDAGGGNGQLPADPPFIEAPLDRTVPSGQGAHQAAMTAAAESAWLAGPNPPLVNRQRARDDYPPSYWQPEDSPRP